MTAFKSVLVKMIATFFGVGYLRPAPGTWGSAAGLLVFVLLGPFVFPALVIFLLAGYLACAPATRVFASGDPSSFVMDEVCGMMIALFAFPPTLVWHLLAFAVFRLLDILKPWPISWVQRQKHPSAIMTDDVLAGIFTGVLGFAVITVVHHFSN